MTAIGAPTGAGVGTGTDRGWSDVAVVVAVVAAVGLSLGTGLYQLLHYHELRANLGYDDGVWYGTAVRLAHGYLPYRDFVLDQPPGVPLLMLPFGLLSRAVGTRDGFAVARLAVPVFEAVAVLAVGWLLRHRGAVAVLVGCGVAAVYPPALVDQRTVMLEPFCAMFCLLGVAVAFSGDRLAIGTRRLVVAGALFGLAGTCKAFAVLPFVVVVVALVVTRRRRVVAFVAGAAAAFVVVCAPFAALDPSGFVHQVVAVQLARSQIVEPSRYMRLFTLIGFVPAPDGVFTVRHAMGVVGLVVAALAAVTVVVYVLSRRYAGRTGITPLDAVAVGMVLVTGYGLVYPTAFYSHYAAFLGPMLGLMAGLIAGRLALVVRRAGVAGPALVAVVAVAAVAALSAATVHGMSVARKTGQGPSARRLIDAEIPAGACVLTDDAPTLLLADRFVSRTHDCDPIVDAFGTTINDDGGLAPDDPAVAATAAVAAWRTALESAQYVVLVYRFTSRRIPWQSTALRDYERSHFRRLASSPVCLILVRRHLQAAIG